MLRPVDIVISAMFWIVVLVPVWIIWGRNWTHTLVRSTKEHAEQIRDISWFIVRCVILAVTNIVQIVLLIPGAVVFIIALLRSLAVIAVPQFHAGFDLHEWIHGSMEMSLYLGLSLSAVIVGCLIHIALLTKSETPWLQALFVD